MPVEHDIHACETTLRKASVSRSAAVTTDLICACVVLASIENLIFCRDAAVSGFIALITCEGSSESARHAVPRAGSEWWPYGPDRSFTPSYRAYTESASPLAVLPSPASLAAFRSWRGRASGATRGPAGGDLADRLANERAHDVPETLSPPHSDPESVDSSLLIRCRDLRTGETVAVPIIDHGLERCGSEIDAQ